MSEINCRPKDAKPRIARSVTPVVVAVAIGCAQGGNPPTAVGSPSVTATTTAPASGNNRCAQAEIGPQQFTGDWNEQGGPTVITLGADGTLASRGGSSNESGTWSYQPWASTPGKDAMPAGEDNECVLWLHWVVPAPPTDLVYVPLRITGTALELSYVGRGNTVTWVRPGNGS